MINLRPTIYQALSTNQTILSLLGGEHIYYMTAPYADELPRITYFEYLNIDNSFAENQPIASNIGFQLDIWSTGDTSAIAMAVDDAMKGIGFSRTYAIEEYEEELRLYRYVMRYTIEIEL